MANDSSLLPTAGVPPGQAPYYTAETVTTIPDAGGTVTGKGIAFDYSDHLDRIVTALEQLSLSLAFVADNTISDNSTLIVDRQTTIANNQTIIADKQTLIESYQKTLKELSEGSGHHIVGPYEWLSMAAIYRIFVEQGVDFASIKQQIDSLPKENGF
jgi:hypothetical protein